jgi:predicted SprT family Zn-dependent metalloprotease/ribosomal protein S27AE
MSNYQTPTAETYNGLQAAFDHFNKELFGERLPPVMFTLTRRTGANGYFHAEQFKHRADGDATHEIALNPNTMDRDIRAVLSTLVHEMTHLEQEEFGKPSKGGHHNMEWANMMLAVGLTPTDGTGKMTGRKVTHTIDDGGPFDVALGDLMPFDIPYFTQPREKAEKKRDISKVKHTCPSCDAKAWAKMGSRLICGDCDQELVGEEV